MYKTSLFTEVDSRQGRHTSGYGNIGGQVGQ